MQDGRSPAHAASANGHTEILALLLSYNADANTADKVEQFKVF